MSSLDPDSLTGDEALRLAVVAARRHEIEAPLVPLRRSANHVFRAGDVVIRVAPRSADVAGQVALARWLVSEGFPVAAPLADPEIVGGGKVSLWQRIATREGRAIDFRQLGEVVARLHRLPPARLGEVVALPFCGYAGWLAVEHNVALVEDARLVDTENYRDFARGYGADLRESPLARELAALRLLAPTINMILAGADNPTCAAEAKTRMRYWLGDPAPPAWTAL